MKVGDGRPARSYTGVVNATPPPTTPSAPSLAAPLGALAALVLSMALVPLRDELGSANVAILLTMVIIAAAAGGRFAGGITAVVAAASFNFLYTQPYLSLRIHSDEDVITVVLLLTVGVAVGWLAQLYGGARARSEQRKADGEAIERVARLVAADAGNAAVWHEVQSALVEQLQLAECRFEAGPSVGRISLAPTGRILSSHLDYTGEGFALPTEGADLPVEFDGQRVGGIVLVPRPKTGSQREERRMAVALAELLAISMARHPEPIDVDCTPGQGNGRG